MQKRLLGTSNVQITPILSEIVPIEETISALNLLKDQGKIRAIGVSNFSGAQLAQAANYGRIDSLQPPYSLFWRQVE